MTAKYAALGELVKIVGGGTPKRSNPAYFGGDIPWVTPKDMKSWEICDAQVKITQLGLDSSAARLVEPGSVLMVVRSGVLKHTLPVGINRVSVAINQDMKALLCGEAIDAEFLARFIKSRSPELLHRVKATTADNLPVDLVKRLRVPLLPINEQRQLGATLRHIDEVKKSYHAAIGLLDELSLAIQDEAFEEN